MSSGRFTSARELCRQYRIKLRPECYALLHPELTPEAYFDKLLEKDQLPEARRVLAHALPRQRALWWACLCVWHAHQGELPVRLAAIIDAVLKFVNEPSEANRRRVQALGLKVKASSLAAALANAAFFAGGSVSKPGLPKVAPRPFVTGRLIGVVVYLAAVSRQPAQYKKVLRYYLEIGLQVARGQLLWPEAETTDAGVLHNRILEHVS